jgi:TPR repeat protein
VTQPEAEAGTELVDNADAGSVPTPCYLAPTSEPEGAEVVPAAEPGGQTVVQGGSADLRWRVLRDLDAVAKAYCATGPSVAARLARVRQEDWQASALLDQPEGLCLAGVCLEYGLWGQTDFKLAMECYRRAASKGLAPAQVILALHYTAGVGVPRNAASALEWFRRAAAQGSAEGQLGVGLVLADRGTAAEQIDGARWLHLAAEQGLPAAQCALGVAYTYGIGVPPGMREARAWYLRAAAQGDRTAAENLAQAEQGAL